MKKIAAVTLFFFCIIVFSSIPPASAHNGVTAEEASAGGEEELKNFLLHLKSHRALQTTDDMQIQFRNALRNNNGVWRHGDMYVITVNKEGIRFFPGDLVFFHGKYPAALSGSLRDIPVFRDLVDTVAEADNGEVVCVQDSSGKYGDHICAVEDFHTTESGTSDSFIQIAGFDHELNEVDYTKATDSCPTREDLQSKGWLSADMVRDEESLVRYLKGVEEHISEEFAMLPGQQSDDNVQGRILRERMIQLMPCWRMEPWQSGSIYFYVVTYTDKQYGIFNGLTPQFQDATLVLIDNNELNVGQAVREEVLKNDDTPNEGFLTYLWDDPVIRGDEVVCEQTGFISDTPFQGNQAENEDEEVFCEEGSPIPGRSPGTSVKLGYFIRTTFGAGEKYYVLGSGIYPNSGGSGCAISAGSGNETEAAAFNLFLVAAALFLAASGKSRSGEGLRNRSLRARRNDVRRQG